MDVIAAALGLVPAPATPAEYEAQAGIPPTLTAPPPRFLTYDAYRAATPLREVRAWCGLKAKRANRVRLMSGRPEERITTDDVYGILHAARGRCSHCGSLAVEGRPSGPGDQEAGAVGACGPPHREPGPHRGPVRRGPEHGAEPAVGMPLVQHVAERTDPGGNGSRGDPVAAPSGLGVTDLAGDGPGSQGGPGLVLGDRLPGWAGGHVPAAVGAVDLIGGVTVAVQRRHHPAGSRLGSGRRLLVGRAHVRGGNGHGHLRHPPVVRALPPKEPPGDHTGQGHRHRAGQWIGHRFDLKHPGGYASRAASRSRHCCATASNGVPRRASCNANTASSSACRAATSRA